MGCESLALKPKLSPDGSKQSDMKIAIIAASALNQASHNHQVSAGAKKKALETGK